MSEFARLPRSMPFVFMLTFQVISRSLKVPLMRSPHASLECWTALRTNAHIDFEHTSSCEPTAVCAHTEFAPETNEKEIKDKWARVRTSERVTEQVCNRCANIHKKKIPSNRFRFQPWFIAICWWMRAYGPATDDALKKHKYWFVECDVKLFEQTAAFTTAELCLRIQKERKLNAAKRGRWRKKKSYRQMVIVDNLLT